MKEVAKRLTNFVLSSILDQNILFDTVVEKSEIVMYTKSCYRLRISTLAELLSDHMLCAYLLNHFCEMNGYQRTPKTHENQGKNRDLLLMSFYTQDGYLRPYM